MFRSGDNYLHVQKWRPNFRAEKEEINTLPVWVRFPILPVEYYTMRWLKKAGNNIGRTVKVDITTLLASRGRFARVCVEVGLDMPLMVGYRMQEEYYMLQYEGLHDLCFGCGRYGHRSAACLEKEPEGKDMSKDPETRPNATSTSSEEPGYGEWTTV